MKLKFYILFLLLLFICIEVAQSQRFIYEYSATGNRKQCYVGFAKIVSPNLPDEQEQYTEKIDNIQFNIFPNPTKGLLKIRIDTGMKVEDLKIELYDVNARKIIEKSVVSKEIELDITSASVGNYFMKIFVNNKPYYWNIMKE